MKGTIAVLIPCYNEEKTIEKVVSDFKKNLPDAVVYVFDNNSTDNSAAAAKSAGAVVRHEYKQGKGNVIRSMFKTVEADCYIMVDGDDTYSAAHAAQMCRMVLEDGADMVIGDRLSSDYFTENKRLFHSFGNRLVRLLINKMFKSKINDVLTGYRAFSRSFVKGIPILSSGFEIETEMTVYALDCYYNIAQIPVEYKDRPIGSDSKLNTYGDGFRVLKTIFVLYRDYYPLYFFSIIAMILLAVAAGLFIPVFNAYLETGLVEKFPTLIVSVSVFIAALLSFYCGLILDCIAKKHKQLFMTTVNNIKNTAGDE